MASYLELPFERYVAYLSGVRHLFPESLFNFASDSERHDLGAKSLHDARLLEASFIRQHHGQVFSGRLAWLSSRRDLVITLIFDGVTEFKTTQTANGGDQDLLGFEILAEKSDPASATQFTFRAMFPGEMLDTEVRCGRISVSEVHVGARPHQR